ncbi:MAG: CRISPR-associated endoribonuclease Cas6 [Ruminococcus sp.]
MNAPIVVHQTNETGFVSFRNPFEQEFCDGIIKNFKNKYETFYGKPTQPRLSLNAKCRWKAVKFNGPRNNFGV